MIGIGPGWARLTQNGKTSDSISGEIAGHFMFWPTGRHHAGWFLEPAYEYSFAAGHQKSVALTAGLLIGFGTEASVMSSISIPRPVDKKILSLQWTTLSWMTVECSVALTAAWKARSVSLAAFGSDSFVELISAAIVLLQFAPRWQISQGRAAKICGLLLFALAGIVSSIAILGLLRHAEADTSRLGIAITVGALMLMPILARLKRREAERTGNKALRADAIQSATCAYLAAITLTGLLLRSFFNLPWLDPLAALAAVPILVVEARRARRGQVCGCC